MDFKDTNNKLDLLKATDTLTNDINCFMKDMINNESDYKKAALIYYWLRDYKNIIKNENHFNIACLPSYKRRNIVSVNFGFNPGAELGGKHYAIVLHDSNKSNPLIAVLQLSSIKDTKLKENIHPSNIYLGREIYHRIESKYNALYTSLKAEIETINEIAEQINPNDNHASEMISKKLLDLDKNMKLLSKTETELKHLKLGSYGIINQIRTVSKMRVLNPTNKYSSLYDLKVSSETMLKIDEKISKFYTLY